MDIFKIDMNISILMKMKMVGMKVLIMGNILFEIRI